MTKRLDREDREILEATLKQVRKEPDSKSVQDNIVDDPSKRPDTASKIAEVEDIINQYDNIVSLSQEIANIIKDRSQDIKVKFNADQNIALRDAIRRVFGIDTDTVTLDMYLSSLDLQEQLAEIDREAMRDL